MYTRGLCAQTRYFLMSSGLVATRSPGTVNRRLTQAADLYDHSVSGHRGRATGQDSVTCHGPVASGPPRTPLGVVLRICSTKADVRLSVGPSEIQAGKLPIDEPAQSDWLSIRGRATATVEGGDKFLQPLLDPRQKGVRHRDLRCDRILSLCLAVLDRRPLPLRAEGSRLALRVCRSARVRGG